ncbi:hypothetical protein D3C78_1919270 [compost metagenome]
MFLVNVFGAIILLPALAAWFNEGRPLVRALKTDKEEAGAEAAALDSRRDAPVGV